MTRVVAIRSQRPFSVQIIKGNIPKKNLNKQLIIKSLPSSSSKSELPIFDAMGHVFGMGRHELLWAALRTLPWCLSLRWSRSRLLMEK
jgi:hypothetical protein